MFGIDISQPECIDAAHGGRGGYVLRKMANSDITPLVMFKGVDVLGRGACLGDFVVPLGKIRHPSKRFLQRWSTFLRILGMIGTTSAG